jgi:hypothetical protein
MWGVQALDGGDRADLGVRDRVDEAQPEQRRRATARDDVRLRRNRLGNEVEETGRVGRIARGHATDGVILQERSALRGQRIEAAVRVAPPESRFQPSVAATDGGIATEVARHARRFVEDRAEAVRHALLVHEVRPSFLEQLHLVRGEPGQRIAHLDRRDQLRAAGCSGGLRGSLRGRRLRGTAGKKNDCCRNDRSSGHAFLRRGRFCKSRRRD